MSGSVFGLAALVLDRQDSGRGVSGHEPLGSVAALASVGTGAGPRDLSGAGADRHDLLVVGFSTLRPGLRAGVAMDAQDSREAGGARLNPIPTATPHEVTAGLER